jgi:glycosyltransferase involved in cell wall biosynthesis
MKNKINILLVSPFFFPTNTYQQELCQKIKEISSNIEIEVLCYQTTKVVVNKFGSLKIHSIPCISILKEQFTLPNYFSLFKILKKLKKEKKIDLLMTETRFFESAWWLPFLAKKWKIPSIIIEHCASSIKHKSLLVRIFGKILDKVILGFILNHYSVVACSNKAVFDYLSKEKVKNLRLIGTGVDINFFNPSKRKSDKEKIRVTFASRLLPTKGVDLFYRSIKPLLSKYPQIKFTIAGYGPMFQKIKNKIFNDTNESRVELIGALSREEMVQLYTDTDIFVYPSFHHDGIPNVLLEAGASGCAIISSKSGGSSEIIKNGETGILLDNLTEQEIQKAIETLINDKEKRLRLATSLRNLIIKNYQWSFVAQKIKDIILKVVGPL